MMRRTLYRAVMAKAKPIYEVLMYVQPAGSAVWGEQHKLCQANHINYVNDWIAMDANTRKTLVDTLGGRLVKQIDDTLASQLGLGASKNLLIAFGSQTGGAEAYAKMIGTMSASHGFTPRVVSLNDAVDLLQDPSHAPDGLIIVCSTYGTGEFPTNAAQFWQKLSNGAIAGIKNVPYAIFGLGNSKNESYNAAAKKLDSKLKSVGAKSILRMQLSCELQPGGHDTAFRTWKRGLWAALGGPTTSDSGLAVSYEVNPVQGAQPLPTLVRSEFQPGMIHANEIVTAKDYFPVSRRLVFQVPAALQRKMLGGDLHGRLATMTDWVDIYPFNEDGLVNRALKRLGLDGNSLVEVRPLPGASPSVFDNQKVSVRLILREIVDLNAMPTRSFLEALSVLATDSVERTKLEDLANNLSIGSEYDKLTSGVFTVVDALEMFPSLRINLAQLITHAPRIQPRTYSMTTDNTVGLQEKFEVVYNIPHREANGKQHDGLCSGYLQRLRAGDKVNVHFRPSNIEQAPIDAPVLLVALGSGIGSMRSVLQHRMAEKARGKTVAPAKLFYGFRNTGKDQLFVEELTKLSAQGIVDVTYVASHDVAGKFITPMDKMTPDIAKFLGNSGHIHYCGLGGSVPSILDAALRRCGIDVSGLRASGRYHEEFFSPDTDTENLIKSHSGAVQDADTLAKRMGNCAMFCFQCEQTYQNKGCHKIGVCGKTPRVAALQDLTVHAVKNLGFYLHELRQLGAKENAAANHLTLQALFATLTNVNFDEKRFVSYLEQLRATTAAAKEQYKQVCAEKKLSPKELSTYHLSATLPSVDELIVAGKAVGVLSKFTDPKRQSVAGVAEMLMYGLKGVAAYTDHSLMNGKEDPAIYSFVQEALAFLSNPESYELGDALKMCLKAGESNVSSMKMLYESNATLGVPKPTPVPCNPVPGKCILVSGHDLVILQGLLKVTEPLGINVYTHGEMLPAHSYGELKKHKNLIGNYGGAWMRQSVEFPHFPGPILMTTNCLTEPHDTYRDRIFTAGAVGWSGVPHIGNTMQDIQFAPLIAAAQIAQGFSSLDTAFAYTDPVGQARPKSLMVGFGHETILSVAPTIIEQINKGNITRFFVVGGCDGYEGQRSYYTELVKKLPKTCVVLTVGCGKYRINHLDLGTIGDTGLPRLLDMGQCNDSFSAVQVALALAKVLNCKVSDLPLSIVLSWFEQKAIAVLLSCLHLGLKPIHVGPSLPAFLTPEVLSVLVKDFGIKVCGDPVKDMEEMLAAKGAS